MGVIIVGWPSGGELWWRPTRQGIANRRLIETMVQGAGSGRLPCFPSLYIGSIDLLVPEKTHRRSHGYHSGVGSLFELFRRLIAEDGM